jgi:hypothetical protein
MVGDALNAVRYSVFINRNVFIVSKRGIRMLKGLTDSPTYAPLRQVKGRKLTEPWPVRRAISKIGERPLRPNNRKSIHQ